MKMCPHCSGEIAEDASRCRYCKELINSNDDTNGLDFKSALNNKKYRAYKFIISWLPAFAFVLLLILNVASFIYLSSKIKKLEINDESRVVQKMITPEEESVRKAFNESMNFRLVANCDSFVDTVANYEEKAKESWGERCRKEKNGDVPPISDSVINRLSIRDDRAFIQANLTRTITLGENVTYTGTYEMIMEDGQWKLMAPKD